MNVKETLWKALINFPTIFPNALSVYNHLFCVGGNGYEWKDGELIEVLGEDVNSHNASTINEAVINFLKYNLIEDWNDGGVMKEFFDRIFGGDRYDKRQGLLFQRFTKNTNANTIIYVNRILNSESRMNDFTLRVDEIIKKFKPDYAYQFYPLSEYSKICCLPDDITEDWLDAANHMYAIMQEHKDLIIDDGNYMEKIGQRLEELNKKYKLL